jgi:type IV secretion system protein TrbL
MTRCHLFALAGLVLLAGSGLAMANTDLHEPSRAFSGLLDLIRNNSNQWSSRLQGYAQTLFWSLAAIDIVLIFGPLVLRNADTGEILGEIVRFVLTIGFFASLLIYSVPWSSAIVDSFRQAGAAAAGVGVQLTPGDMFSLGVELAYTVSDVNTLNPGVAFSVAASAIVILLCFTFIAAFMAFTLAQSYVLIYAAVLFMGFGGSKYTREYAISPIRYAVAVGAKLFALTLIVGIVMNSARDWQSLYQHDNTSMWTLMGLAAFCALLSKTVPDFIEGMITGASSGGGGAIGGMAAAGAAGAAAGAATMHSLMSSGMMSGVGSSIGDLLKSSGSGSGGAASSSMNSPMGSGSSGGQRTGGPSPRVGGGMGSGSGPAPGPAPKASGPASGGGSGSASGSAPSGGTASAPKSQSVASMAHAAAEMGIKTFGTASSIAVPGMEGAESLSVGPPPSPPDLDGVSVSDTPENIIRPVSDAPVAGESSTTTPQPIDTMSDLKQALNNRGKP